MTKCDAASVETNDLNVRDPFILRDRENRCHILYRRVGAGEIEARESSDLKTWKNPRTVYRPDPELKSFTDFWAPEVHFYAGKYYLFLTLTPPGGCRGVWCFRADCACGPFERFSDKPLTPESWFALDGTLYVENGAPYLVFCHEWVQIRDGAIDAVRLKDDLSGAAGAPVRLFSASEASWTIPKGEDLHRVTDGPFLYRAPSGTLYMIWSGFSASGYATGVARSSGGSIFGKWTQCPGLLWDENGGHGMIFLTSDGAPMCVLHTPNSPASAERMRFFRIGEKAGTLMITR